MYRLIAASFIASLASVVAHAATIQGGGGLSHGGAIEVHSAPTPLPSPPPAVVKTTAGLSAAPLPKVVPVVSPAKVITTTVTPLPGSGSGARFGTIKIPELPLPSGRRIIVHPITISEPIVIRPVAAPTKPTSDVLQSLLSDTAAQR